MRSRSSASSPWRCSFYCIFTIISTIGCFYFLFLLVLLVTKDSVPPDLGKLREMNQQVETSNKQIKGYTIEEERIVETQPVAVIEPIYLRKEPLIIHTLPPKRLPEPIASIKKESMMVHEVKEIKPVASSPAPVKREEEEAESHPKTVHPFPPPVTFTTPVSSSSPPPAVLVVGGTDGSGTRRVVQVLTELGVAMVSEDPETYDIHGDLVGGWPPLVRPVLAATHSLNYDPAKVDGATHSQTLRQAGRLLQQVERDSHLPTSYTLAVGGVLPLPLATPRASQVLYGFKAPVAMTLVPYWSLLLPACRFLHVVRDGRDIAFSANQGPVDKFYGDMYRRHLDKMRYSGPIKAIQLWSDWNSAIHAWSQERAAKAAKDGSHFFSYHLLHSEDLVAASHQQRFMAIYQLARWVGSALSEERLCCLAVKQSEFMGSHDRTPRRAEGGQQQGRGKGQGGDKAAAGAEQVIASRYGKWKARTQHDLGLLKSLYDHGGAGLSLFGYHNPSRSLPSADMTTDSGYLCSLTEQQCQQREEQEVKDAFISAPDYVLLGQCEASFGFDYKGSDLGVFTMEAGDNQSCCRRCLKLAGCQFFTIDPASHLCYLKGSDGHKKVMHPSLVSGQVLTLRGL